MSPSPRGVILPQAAALLFVFLFTLSQDMAACGIDWSLPTNHFEGVNEMGYVSIWKEVGQLDCGNGLRLPLNINFCSQREASSPYLGAGWMFAFLESQIVQTSERDFKLVQPEGRFRLFGRSKANPLLLEGQGGWKAEIKGDTITAWADCGWKLVFVKGKIKSLTTPKNRRLDYIYSAGRVSEVRESGATLISVEIDPGTNQTKAIVVNGLRMAVSLAQRPRIQIASGQTLVAGMAESLRRFSDNDESYEFGTDEKLQPTLTISKTGKPQRVVVWHPGTKRILADDAWVYDIRPADKLAANALMSRRHLEGRTESWVVDAASGREIETIDGAQTIRTSYVSGVLAGHLRTIVREANGTSTTLYRAAYDDKGKLVRLIRDGKTRFFQYDKSGKLISFRDGETGPERHFSEAGY
jgi:hypothetical protein